uniref:Cadherin EGF LAG seven-pass G-type receptor 1 n=1 Tax=Magallana gigas TaxID=29159 RepID=K1PF79_MAGGI
MSPLKYHGTLPVCGIPILLETYDDKVPNPYREQDGLHLKTASCRLYVRLVTKEMLEKSVTIRLNNITQDTFLSPVYKFFVDALASVLNTEEKNIYVINVEKDTDVSTTVLNVSVAVRKSDGSFIDAEVLQEQIYLQRIRLADLSTLQVLPFEDNICIREFCDNFEHCIFYVKFGRPQPFITSSTMLFRPIHPVNSFRCECPAGYALTSGNYCNKEIDACYSSPCKNGGACKRKEGGFTCLCAPNFAGETCEINNNQQFDLLTCPQNLCEPPSECEPNKNSGGFRCKGCPAEPHYNKYCQLTSRKFSIGSYLTFPAFKRRFRFNIQLKFATQMKNGLLFYNGRFNDRNDFMALEIVDGQLQFSFSTGTNKTSVRSKVKGGVANGEWQFAQVDYINRTATLSVGEECDTQIAVKCYTSAVPKVQCPKFLDLNGPMQIGGLPNFQSQFQIVNRNYKGCIKDFYVDHQLLDLNKFVFNNGTVAGCTEKTDQCISAPCKHGGTCHDRWGTYFCECPDRAGGKDCSQVIDQPTRLEGNGFLLYTENSLTSKMILYTWYNGISFRTRATAGVLMYVVISEGHSVTLELIDGYAHYRVGGVNNTFKFDYLPVNDGKWHYLEVRWPRLGEIILVMDYGHWQKKEAISVSLNNKLIERVYVGAERENDGPITKGFVGCLENMIVGNTNTALLSRPSHSNSFPGCTIPSACKDNPCTQGASCVDHWGKHECVCPKGTLGPECKDICRNYNPCQNAAICHGPTYKPTSPSGYTCQCGQLQGGRYCEEVSTQPCQDGWYGFPVCGPCNCSYKLGFDTKCNKTDGTCYCQENYYRPIGSDRCYPCDCYKYGSTSIYCDKVTGQCPCKKNVIGRKCDQCENKYAHISWNPNDDIGCLVTNSMCPRQFHKIMWWEAITFTESGHVTAVQDCPYGAVGDAKRNCSKTELWSEPDLFNCTNKDFVSLESQIDQIERKVLNITTLVAKTLASKLASATSNVKVLFGNDINITYRVVNQLLKYENKQYGLSLTVEQDSNYLQNLLDALSRALDPQHAYEWSRINQESGGIAEIFYRLENYLDLLTRNLDSMQKNPYRVVSKHIVLSVDTLTSSNTSGLKIPKFDNIVAFPPTFDDLTHVLLPPSISPSMAEYIQQVMAPGSDKFYVSYIMFDTLGELLPRGAGSLHSSVVQNPGRELAVNAPVFTLLIRDRGCAIKTGFSEPLKFHFKQKVKDNRTSPQCVYWKTSPHNVCNHTDSGTDHSYQGQWSSEGCTVDKRYEVEISGQGSEVKKDMYVVCSCSHMTSFSVLMEVADSEYVSKAVISLVIFSFVGIGISLVCLFVSFVIFCSFKRLQCNANSILVNLVFTMFVAELAFITGVYRVSSKLMCRLVAICLHYFYLAAFSWLFVEMLHLYRRLIEIRDINHGTMKFYYLLGYVIPGIIVGLSVGLYTDGYGNSSFCWMDISETFIWSFAGPVAFVIPATIMMFVLALHSSCQEKVNVSDITSFRARIFSGVILLLLLGITWILGLLSVNYDLQPLHYVYAGFAFLQGLFIFLAYIVGDKKVRYNLKKQWYKMQGKKMDPDDSMVGSRPSISRSALAYRRDSSIDGYINRTNVGISTTSTTSRSTSKSSGGLYKGDDYLRSTDTSTSGHAPSYAYDNAYHQKSGEEGDVHVPGRRSHRKRRNHDSDSESDVSIGQASIELASSHSSDEEDDFDIGPSWEKQLPKNKKIEEAKEQMKKKKQQQEQGQLPPQDSEALQNQQNLKHLQPGHPGLPLYTSVPNYGHWPGDPNLSGFHMSESDYQQTVSSNPPDVTLPAQQELQDDTNQNHFPGGGGPLSGSAMRNNLLGAIQLKRTTSSKPEEKFDPTKSVGNLRYEGPKEDPEPSTSQAAPPPAAPPKQASAAGGNADPMKNLIGAIQLKRTASSQPEEKFDPTKSVGNLRYEGPKEEPEPSISQVAPVPKKASSVGGNVDPMKNLLGAIHQKKPETDFVEEKFDPTMSVPNLSYEGPVEEENEVETYEEEEVVTEPEYESVAVMEKASPLKKRSAPQYDENFVSSRSVRIMNNQSTKEFTTPGQSSKEHTPPKKVPTKPILARNSQTQTRRPPSLTSLLSAAQPERQSSTRVSASTGVDNSVSLVRPSLVRFSQQTTEHPIEAVREAMSRESTRSVEIQEPETIVSSLKIPSRESIHSGRDVFQEMYHARPLLMVNEDNTIRTVMHKHELKDILRDTIGDQMPEMPRELQSYIEKFQDVPLNKLMHFAETGSYLRESYRTCGRVKSDVTVEVAREGKPTKTYHSEPANARVKQSPSSSRGGTQNNNAADVDGESSCDDEARPANQIQWENADLIRDSDHTDKMDPSRNHTIVFLNKRMYIIGGCHTMQGEMTPRKEVLVYDKICGTWKPLAPLLTARMYHSLCVVKGQIYAIGGLGEDNSILNTVECYDPSSNCWYFVKSMAEARMGACAAEYGGQIYIAGGYGSRKMDLELNITILDSFECFNPHSNKWTPKRNVRYGRCHANLMAVGHSLFLCGGVSIDRSSSDPELTSVADVDEYDVTTDTWVLKTCLLEERHDACCVKSDDKIYLVGGISTNLGQSLGDTECFDPQENVTFTPSHVPHRVDWIKCATSKE